LCLVLLFTTALFLSGCVIQQRTLRELRAAIKPTPRPSPKIFLPDRFKQATTELKDGTIIIIDDEQKPIVVEVKTTAFEAKPEPAAASPKEAENVDAAGRRDAQEEKTSILNREKHGQLEQTDAEVKEEALTDRERKIQQQRAESLQNPDPLAADQSLMSRAERRKLIKQELRKLQEVEGRGYQRRLW
jgi:hypothetical protein